VIESGDVPRNPNTAVRRALLWWFRPPASPYVSLNFAVEFGPARAYLDRLAKQEGTRVTVQDLLAAAVARTLHAHPLANAQIVRNRIVLRERVGVAVPVNLLGHPGGARRELGVTVVARAESLSLRDLAETGRRSVAQERQGHGTNGLIRALTRLAEIVPQPVFFAAMDVVDQLRQAPLSGEWMFRAMPATTLLSNAGAAFSKVSGVVFRGASISPPPRLGHVGTVWGVSAVQDEVVVADGQPAVRPMLPIVLVFDHRLVDGVAAGRLALYFAGILADPETSFGPRGRRVLSAKDCRPR